MCVLVPTLAVIVGVLPPAGGGASDVRAFRLTVFDVGQGESILLQSPGAEPMLIDTGGAPFGGGSFDIGGRVLAPALWARGMRRLDTLLLTHGDPDHIGGALAVVRDFAPAQLWQGIPVPGHRPLQEVLDDARRRGVVVSERIAPADISFGRSRVRILHPSPADWERPRVRNDDSVVLEVTFGDVALLLTGDIGAAIEREILPQLTPEAEDAMTSTIGCAIAVHRALGPGFLESIYKKAMHIELANRGLSFESERPIQVKYAGIEITGQRVDLIVEGLIVVELKSVVRLDEVHRAQLISYLRTAGLRGGLLINFRVPVLREAGIRRVVL
jgi:competence protein ComEC